MALELIRELDTDGKEWLLIQDEETTGMKDYTILKLEWNNDLMLYIEQNQERVRTGDYTVFTEYWEKKNFR